METIKLYETFKLKPLIAKVQSYNQDSGVGTLLLPSEGGKTLEVQFDIRNTCAETELLFDSGDMEGEEFFITDISTNEDGTLSADSVCCARCFNDYSSDSPKRKWEGKTKSEKTKIEKTETGESPEGVTDDTKALIEEALKGEKETVENLKNEIEAEKKGRETLESNIASQQKTLQEALATQQKLFQEAMLAQQQSFKEALEAQAKTVEALTTSNEKLGKNLNQAMEDLENLKNGTVLRTVSLPPRKRAGS